MKTKQITLIDANLIVLKLILAREKQQLLDEYLLTKERSLLVELVMLRDAVYQLSDDIKPIDIFVTPNTIMKYAKQAEEFNDAKASWAIIDEIFNRFSWVYY